MKVLHFSNSSFKFFFYLDGWKKQTKVKCKHFFLETGVGESQITYISTPMSVRSNRAGNNAENIPLVPLDQQGGNREHTGTQEHGSVGNLENVGRTIQEPADRTFTWFLYLV